jgi:HlyD family secretion protein
VTKTILRAGVVLLALILAGAWWWSRGSAPDKAQADRYKTEPAERGTLTRYVSANGTLNPVILVNVGTQVSGTVKAINADFNQKVKAGQILAELDPALLKAALAQSAANLVNARAQQVLAKANEARIRNLASQEYASKQELDQAVAAREQADAQVKLASAQVSRDQTNLNFSVIRSPVSGTVIDRQVDVGQTVAASFQTPTLFKIGQDLTRMQIDTTVAEADIGSVKVGQDVNFRVDAYPDKDFKGKVRQIRLNAATLQNVVTYDVVVDVANPDLTLLPGMTANARIEVESKPDVLMVPAASLRFRPAENAASAESAKQAGKKKGGGAAVYKLTAGKLVRVPVKPGISDQQNTEILQGDIKEGDELVVADNQAAGKNSQGGAPRGRLF